LLDGLPLALAQAGTYIRETGIDFAKYVDFYKQQWRDLMELQDRGGAPLYDYGGRSIWTTWTISFKAIQKTNEAAANLLLLWAFLDNRDLWYGLLAAAGKRSAVAAEQLSKWLQDIPSSELKFNEAVQLLRNYSMIESMHNSASYATHPVVHKWALYVQDQDQRMGLARMAVLAVGFAVPDSSTREYWTAQRRLLPHAQCCSQWILDGVADTSNGVQGGYRKGGADEECEEEIFDAILWLGRLYFDQDKPGEAEKMYQRALQGYEKAWGLEHTSTLDTVNNLGSLYAKLGKLDQAEDMYQRALRGKEKAWGPEHTSTLDTVNNLGNLYADLGKLDQAEDMYQRALQGYEKAWGLEHTSTLDTVNNLGLLYAKLGKLDQAEDMYQQALLGYEKAWGLEHTSTLDTVNNLGLLYAKLGKLDQAEDMYQRALQGKEKAWGLEHTSTLDTVNNLGLLYADLGKLDQAEDMYQRAL
jgi:tetratricopeptide (TPR) repeat protein